MDKHHKIIKCIVISGIDGSGKTTVINALKENLTQQGYRVSYIWLRFNHYLAKAMHLFARMSGLSIPKDNEMGHVWQHQFYKSKLFCWLYIRATYVDTLISRLKYNKVAKGSDVVICDRWVTDILVDLATKTHDKDFIHSKWTKRFIRIMPKESRLFIVHRNISDVLECRIENQIDPDFKLRMNVYEDIKHLSPFLVVGNNGTVENSVQQIICNIYE